MPLLLEDLAEVVEPHEWVSIAVDGGQVDVPSFLTRKQVCPIVVPAPALVLLAEWDQRWLLGTAAVVGQRAAVSEHTAGELGAEAWKKAGDRVQSTMVLAHASARDAAEQSYGVRVARILEDRLDWSFLDEAARVEHADAGTHLGDHAEVVTDEEHRRLEFGLEPYHAIEHFRLHGRVEPGRGLVEDEKRGVLGERHCDNDALLHSARELMGKAAEHAVGVGDLHCLQHLE